MYEVNLYTQFTETSVFNSGVQSGSREAVCQALCLLAISVIPPVLQTYLHLHAPLPRRTNGNILLIFNWTHQGALDRKGLALTGHVTRWPVLGSGPVHVRPTAGKLELGYFLFPTKYFGLSLSLSLHQCSIHIFALRTAKKRRTLQNKWCLFANRSTNIE